MVWGNTEELLQSSSLHCRTDTVELPLFLLRLHKYGEKTVDAHENLLELSQ